MMRPSLFLTIIGLAGNLASGFSAKTVTGVVSRATLGSMTPFATKAYPNQDIFVGRGGGTAMKASAKPSEPSNCPMRKLSLFVASVYGTGGVMYILIKAIRRVVPIALEPFAEGAVPLSVFQLSAYVATVLWFAYVEGYKGFQTKFSPLVVSRSLTLEPGHSSIHHFLLAPFYSMGLFHSTRKRMIVSWSVSLGVFAIVHAVKKLPYPWRNIVDAGVVAGLTWGCVSMGIQYVKALMSGKPPGDPVLPESKSS